MRPGPKTVPEGPLLVTTERGRCHTALPSVVLRRSLQKAITAAKNRAWSELVEAVEADPWGRPYKTVTRKLRAKGPLATAEMELELLQQIVETLFPPQEDSAAEQLQDTTWTGEWTDDWEVTEEELRKATRRMATRDTAPGPDGGPGRIWGEIMGIMAPKLRRLYTKCLKEGVYPRAWRTARLVLLRKEGRPMNTPSAYRPICLLDEVGKFLERVVAA